MEKIYSIDYFISPSCIGDAHQVSAGNRRRRDVFWVTIQEKIVEGSYYYRKRQSWLQRLQIAILLV